MSAVTEIAPTTPGPTVTCASASTAADIPESFGHMLQSAQQRDMPTGSDASATAAPAAVDLPSAETPAVPAAAQQTLTQAALVNDAPLAALASVDKPGAAATTATVSQNSPSAKGETKSHQSQGSLATADAPAPSATVPDSVDLTAAAIAASQFVPAQTPPTPATTQATSLGKAQRASDKGVTTQEVGGLDVDGQGRYSGAVSKDSDAAGMTPPPSAGIPATADTGTTASPSTPAPSSSPVSQPAQRPSFNLQLPASQSRSDDVRSTTERTSLRSTEASTATTGTGKVQPATGGSAAAGQLSALLTANSVSLSSVDTAQSTPTRANRTLTEVPSAQIGPALLTLAKAPDGSHQMTVQLHPEDLGMVQIQIDKAADGTTQINITADRADTLQALRSDQPALHRTLDEAGISSAGRSVAFHMAQSAPVAPAAAVTNHVIKADGNPTGRGSTGAGASNGDGSNSGRGGYSARDTRTSSGWRASTASAAVASASVVEHRTYRVGLDITA